MKALLSHLTYRNPFIIPSELLNRELSSAHKCTNCLKHIPWMWLILLFSSLSFCTIWHPPAHRYAIKQRSNSKNLFNSANWQIFLKICTAAVQPNLPLVSRCLSFKIFLWCIESYAMLSLTGSLWPYVRSLTFSTTKYTQSGNGHFLAYKNKKNVYFPSPVIHTTIDLTVTFSY